MDQEDEPTMGQTFTYWRLVPEVGPDEGFDLNPKRR